MKKMQSIILTTTLMLISVATSGQEYIYNLSRLTMQYYNPSAIAVDNDASVSFLNRNTTVSTGIRYSNNLLNMDYPLITNNGKRYGGVGLTFYEEDAGQSDLLKTYQAGLSMAYNLGFIKSSFLSFGMQVNYVNRRVSLDNLTTGSQWLDFSFNPDAPLDEPLVNERMNYVSIDAGLTWYMRTEEGKDQGFIGVALHNVNQPAETFLAQPTILPVNLLVNAGALVYEQGNFSLTPQVVYQRRQSNDAFSLLVSGAIAIKNDNPYDILRSGQVELLTKYDLGRDLSLGAFVHQPGISIGFSYTFSLSSAIEYAYLQGGTEVGIQLSKTLWKVKPKTIVIENEPLAPKRSFDFSQQEPVVIYKSDTEVVQENITEHSEVKAVRFELSKDFKFDFAKAALNQEGKEYLRGIYQLLGDNPDYKIKVIGHTDNVGRPQINYQLSKERARVVAAYLQELGLQEERVTYVGRGDTEPVMPNDTEENKARNRRVELIIYVD